MKPGATFARVDLPPLDLPVQLSAYEGILAGVLRPSLAMSPVPVSTPLPVLSTKLGGVPDLPPGAPWPSSADDAPMAFVLQLNLTDLADRFTDLLPWPTGGGIVQLFTGDSNVFKVLIHRDLAALRPATPRAEPAGEYRLDPVVKGCVPDQPPELYGLRQAYEQLGKEHPELVALLQDWCDQHSPAALQVGGAGLWVQDVGYAEAWAQDHGGDPFAIPLDEENYTQKLTEVYDQVEEQARADGWQLVFNLLDDHRVPERFAWDGGFYLLAPSDAAGRWDLARLQLIHQG